LSMLLLPQVTERGHDPRGRREQCSQNDTARPSSNYHPSPQHTEPAATRSFPSSHIMLCDAFHVCHAPAISCRHSAKHHTWQVTSRLTTLAIFLVVQTLQRIHTLGEYSKTTATLFQTALTLRTSSPRRVELPRMITRSWGSAGLESKQHCVNLKDCCVRNNVRNVRSRSTRHFVR
jgi:hypothetical protein